MQQANEKSRNRRRDSQHQRRSPQVAFRAEIKFQAIGHVVPMTYFNRLARGILLKGNTFPDLWPDLWPLLAFIAVVMTIALSTYRRTLD